MANKEWNGNSRSVSSLLGLNKHANTNGRETDDFYATDPVALEKLINGASNFLGAKFEQARTEHDCIWEPACGNGNLAEYLKQLRFDVCASDLKDRGYGNPNLDFLKAKATAFNIIITNPPYSLATEFIEHALEILPTGGVYIALMNINTLAGVNRYRRIYQHGTLREVYVFSKRIECWRNNDKTIQTGPMANYVWLVFQKGYCGQPTLYWL